MADAPPDPHLPFPASDEAESEVDSHATWARICRGLGRLLARTWQSLDLSPTRTTGHAAVWLAAGLVGLSAVLYTHLIAAVQRFYFDQFGLHPIAVAVAGPALFVLATWLVRHFAPDARGSGIPQVLVAMNQPGGEREWASPLVSVRTAAVKVLSSCVGILGGASIGREGPTVQIAAAGFNWCGKRLRRYSPQIEFRSFLTAGAAAGVAAAFNTPIAGLTFAIEEIGGSFMGATRQAIMLAIIVSGIVAQGLSGNYLYFGHPVIDTMPVGTLVAECLLIGLVGGVLGGFFARTLAAPRRLLLPGPWWVQALIAGSVCSLIGILTQGDTSGSGYEVTRHTLESSAISGTSVLFPVSKLITTSLSYASGMAGGIFSPSLSIGAGVGLSAAKLLGFANFKACALLGMVAFFAGAVQAPLTAVIIVMEMTDEHLLVIPFMVTAFLAYSAGRRIMKEPLYHVLARHYR